MMSVTGLQWARGSRLDNHAVVVAVSLVLSTLMGTLYWMSRSGFYNPVQPVAALVCLSWFIATVPFALHMALFRTGARGSWAASASALTLFTVAGTAALGWLHQLLPSAVFYLLCITGVLLGALILGSLARRLSIRAALGWAIGLLLLGLWVAGVEWTNGFLSPLFRESLILKGGTGHVDTLFLVSLSNMLQLHGVPSTGLNGIPEIVYHFGSGWTFAQLANFSETKPLDFYLIGIPVVIIPFFFRGIMLAALDLRVQAGRPGSDVGAPIWFAFLILAACTIGVLPPTVLHSAAVWASGPLLNEGYTLAVPISLLVSATAVVFWRERSELKATPVSVVTFLFLFLPIAFAVVGVIKVSEMILLLAALGWFFLRLRLWRQPLYLVSFLLILGVVAFVYLNVVWSGRSRGIIPFNFMRTYIQLSWVPFFPLIHLAWCWIYVALRLYGKRLNTWAETRASLARHELLDVEIVVLVAFLGLVPGNILDIWSDSYYFSDFQRWLSLMLLLGSPALLRELRDLLLKALPGRDGQVLLSRAAIFALVLPVALTLVITPLLWGGRFVRDNLDTRREIQRKAGIVAPFGIAVAVKKAVRSVVAGNPGRAADGFRESQIAALGNSRMIENVVTASPRFPVIHALEEIGTLPENTRRESVIFIDPSISEFWNLLPFAPNACFNSAMVAPMLARTPLISGVPAGCIVPHDLGGEAYMSGPRFSLSVPGPTDGELCARAREKGFQRIITIFRADNQVRVRPLSCG